MATATIDGLEVSYVVKGSGPALLMLAPGGFDATMEKWTTAGVWKGMRPLDTLTSDFTLIAYDRRESGLWREPRFAEGFQAQDAERYHGLVAASGRTLFDRDMPPGAEPEEIMAMKVPALILPGDDPAHAASGAFYLRELLPQPEFWPVMPPEQTPDRVRERIVEFGRAHK